MKQPSCIIPLIPHALPTTCPFVTQSPLWRISISSLKLISYDKAHKFQAFTATYGFVSPGTPSTFFFHWTQWTLSLSFLTFLHLCYLPSSATCPDSSISLSRTLSFLAIPPSSPNNTQPSELSHCAFVSDILDRVAMPFPLVLHGWLKPSVASDPYFWQHFTLTPPSELIFPPYKDLGGLARSTRNGKAVAVSGSVDPGLHNGFKKKKKKESTVI